MIDSRDNPTIITVTGDEAKLVQAAEMVQMNAERRSRSEAPNGTILPMTFYETEMERNVMAAFHNLCDRYRIGYGLKYPPLLVPGPEYPVIQRHHKDPPREFIRRQLTDMELAKLLLSRVILRRKGEQIFRFNGIYYERMDRNDLDTLIFGSLREELSVNGSSKQIKSVAAAIMAEPEIEVSEHDVAAYGLCLQNGVLNVSTFELYPHCEKFFFTWKMSVNWCGPQPCPVFDAFLHTVTGGDPILMQRFWEAIAYILMPGDNRAKRFVIMIGLGDTGKSVLGELLSSFFDPDFVGSVDIFKLGDRFSLSTLVYKLINISMDLSDAALTEQAVSIIKQITGRDLVQVEEKYKTPYSTRINCKLVFGTNHALRMNSYDQAFANRILYLPFSYPIPIEQQDRNLLSKLLPERSGILHKALQAYRRLVANGYIFSGDSHYNLAYAHQPAEQIADQLTTLEEFVETQCEEEEEGFVSTETLHERYLLFCQTLQCEGIKNRQSFSAKFNAVIKRYPAVVLIKKRVNGVPCNGYKGICLRK